MDYFLRVVWYITMHKTTVSGSMLHSSWEHLISASINRKEEIHINTKLSYVLIYQPNSFGDVYSSYVKGVHPLDCSTILLKKQ